MYHHAPGDKFRDCKSAVGEGCGIESMRVTVLWMLEARGPTVTILHECVESGDLWLGAHEGAVDGGEY